MQSESTLRNEIASLRAAIDQLYSLNELARLIGASDDLETTIQVLTRRTISLLKAEQGVITLQEEVGEDGAKTLFRTRLDSHAAMACTVRWELFQDSIKHPA